MSKDSQLAKVDFMLEMITNIEKIIKRHNGIIKTLEDFEGQMAILMAISQIGEQLKKLEPSLIEKFDLKEDVEGAYYTRNYIVHDYENVDLMLVENILRTYLPQLKSKISKIKIELQK